VGPETGERYDGDHQALPFAGRTDELDLVDRRLQALATGEGGALVVEGEAGVGKSRLVAEAVVRHPALVISTVRGEPYGTTFPYRALRDTVRALVRVDRAAPEVMTRQFVRRLRSLDPSLVPLAPLIGEVAHIAVPTTTEVDEIEPRFRRDRLAEASIRLIEDRVPGPLVIVVEDAQWVDEASAHLLSRVAEAATAPESPRPWLIIAIRRPLDGGFVPPDAPAALLEPLSTRVAEELVWAATEAAPLRPHDVAAIVSRAAGNPLFLQEILRLVDQTGGTANLPETLDSVIGAEIDALPRGSRQLLRCASVLGRSFRVETLQVLMTGEGVEIGAVPQDDLGRFIEVDGERWRFRQALVRDVAYEGLSFRRRADLHGIAAAAVTALAGDGASEHAGLLSLHWYQAKEYAEAWRWALEAATRARANFANVEAITLYERAVASARHAGEGVTGSNADAATCMSLKEANALNRIWFGATSDGSFDVAQGADARSGKSLGKNQLWWTFTKSTAIGSQITSASSYGVALALQDISYAPDASTSSGDPITNGSTNVRNKWGELDYAGLADAVNKGVVLQPTLFSDLITDKPDLGKLRDLGRKVIVYTGLVDDAIPPAGNINYHERVVAAMGGHAEVQKFMRMYLLPGSADSSQGRTYTVGGKNDTVPLPKLPGNANQTPTREQDQFFTALVDWVEKGTAPGEVLLTSRDNSLSYPVCVYPLKTTWNGSGPVTQATSFSCQ
jgi:hypothetical protein